MKWIYKDTMPVSMPQQFSDLDPILLQLLFNRGMRTKEDIQNFLYADRFADPYSIPDMKECVACILKAKGKKVVIHGDYDVDGVSSSAIMYLYLKDVVHIEDVTVYIPNRHEEGYGLSETTIDTFIKEKVDLLITVDCGIKDVALVAKAKEAGMQVIISDHHTPGEMLPKADALIHPMFYPYKNLCGAGIALTIIRALDKELGVSNADTYVDLAGLGTVCDVMELVGENRVIVKKALKALRSNSRPGLEELFSLAKLDKRQIDTYHIGYVVGPRLNASGRLLSAYESLNLLTAKNAGDAKKYALSLTQLNKRRQDETASALQQSLSYVNAAVAINVVYIAHISMGVIGLVAGKLTEMTQKPSIVLTNDSKADVYTASCRSIEELDIVETLERYKEYFVSYGGHKKAAGFKIHAQKYAVFKDQIEEFATSKLRHVIPEKILSIDMKLDLSVYPLSTLFHLVTNLEPFGEGCPKPLFSSQVTLMSMSTIGENGKHLKCMLVTPQGVLVEGIGFNMGERVLSLGQSIEIVYNIGRNVWNNREKFQLVLVDIRSIA